MRTFFNSVLSIFKSLKHLNKTVLPEESMEFTHYYTPEHFIVEEFVDPATFARRGTNSLGNIDVRMLITADEIREYFNKPVTINNWKWNGPRKWSGLRTKDYDYFKYDSQHSFGRALDFIIKGVDAQEIRDEIKNHQSSNAFRFITRMEEFEGMNWCHIDCKNQDISNGIYIFKP